MTLKILVFCLATIYCLYFIVRNIIALKNRTPSKKGTYGRYFEIVACICILSITSLWCLGAEAGQIWNVAAIALALFALYFLASILTNFYKSVKCICNGTAKVTTGTIVMDIVIKLLGMAVFAKLLYDVVAQIG